MLPLSARPQAIKLCSPRYHPRLMTATATMLQSLDVISAETVTMLAELDTAKLTPDRREAKRRVLEIKANAQELFDWLTAVGLEETRN
ncbi:MAG: hypothetical protein QOF63_3357 [Thermoanaerobaculia bacterium]|nr:hypothetical protein [Thermoanaerobaculia bacterium]